MNITCVTVDCANPEAVARFWNEALRWTGVQISERGQSAVCAPPVGGTYLEFVRVPEGKTVKNRLHLGCNAGSISYLEIEIERLKALGATVAWEEDFGPGVASRYRNVILQDVEGNEFCIGAGDSKVVTG